MVRATIVIGGVAVGFGGLLVRKGVEDFPACLRPHLDEEPTLAVRVQFGQREVVAGLGLGAGVHRSTEAGSAGLAAVHRDEEGILAARPVVRVSESSAKKDPVLDGDCVELAGPHPDESEPLGGRFLGNDLHIVALPL